MAVIAAATTGGVGAIIAYLGVQAAVAPYMIEAYNEHMKVKSEYEDIKLWGTKL